MEKYQKILLLIFVITLSFRLYFAFQTPAFDYDAYFNLRQINEISTTATPLFHDPLSYGSRTLLFTPPFHYLLAFFNLFLPSILVFKLIPNILASTLVFIIYLIAKKITDNANISLLTAFVSAFIPVFIAETANSISVYSLIIPLTFLIIYFILNLEKKKFINYFILSIFILPLIHPSSFLLIIGLLFYLILIRLERLKQDRAELELILFSIFLVIWIQFLIFKNAFLVHGSSVIRQNIPAQLLSLYFAQINILAALLNIGLIPLICGVYIVYRYLFREKNKEIYLLIGFALSTSLLLWFKLIQLTIGLAFLGILLTLLFAQFYKLSLTYIKKTRFAAYKKHFFVLFILIFLFTSIIPSFYFAKEKIKATPTLQETEALLWLKNNSDKNSTVLGTLKQGHLITALASRKNIIDSNFLLAKAPSQRLQDLERIYKTHYKTEAVQLLNKYKIDYIIFSAQTKSELGIDEIRYIDDRKCFMPVYDKDVKIYKSVCKIEEV